MVEITVQGFKYNIKPVPPKLTPFSALIGDKLRVVPKDMADAEAIAIVIDAATKRLFSELVEPQPLEEHKNQVFDALLSITGKAVNEMCFLRPKQKSDGDAGNGVGDASGGVAESGASSA